MSVVVHGDDFTALGTSQGLDKYEQAMSSAFDCKLKGRLGHEKGDLQEARVLNRILSVTSQGMHYEADPRHVELLARALGLDAPGSKHAATPGLKPKFEDNNDADESLEDIVASIKLLKHKSFHVRFSPEVQVAEIPCYSEEFGQHPREFLLSGP